MELTLELLGKHYNKTWISHFAIPRPDIPGKYACLNLDTSQIEFRDRGDLEENTYLYDVLQKSMPNPIAELRMWDYALRTCNEGATYIDVMKIILDRIARGSRADEFSKNKQAPHQMTVYAIKDGLYYYFDSKGKWKSTDSEAKLHKLAVWGPLGLSDTGMFDRVNPYPTTSTARYKKYFSELKEGMSSESIVYRMAVSRPFSTLPYKYRFMEPWAEWRWKEVFSTRTVDIDKAPTSTQIFDSVIVTLNKTYNMLGFTKCVVRKSEDLILESVKHTIVSDPIYRELGVLVEDLILASIENAKTHMKFVFILNTGRDCSSQGEEVATA